MMTIVTYRDQDGRVINEELEEYRDLSPIIRGRPERTRTIQQDLLDEDGDVTSTVSLITVGNREVMIAVFRAKGEDTSMFEENTQELPQETIYYSGVITFDKQETTRVLDDQ